MVEGAGLLGFFFKRPSEVDPISSAVYRRNKVGLLEDESLAVRAAAVAGLGIAAGVAGSARLPNSGGSLPMRDSAYKFPYGQQGSRFLRNNWWMKANVASRLLYPLAWLGVGAETSRRSLEYVGAWEQLGALSTERALGYLSAQYDMYSALEAQRHANIEAQQQGAGMRDYQYRMYYNQSQGGYYYPRADSYGNAGMGW